MKVRLILNLGFEAWVLSYCLEYIHTGFPSDFTIIQAPFVELLSFYFWQECIKLCRSELTAESPIYPGDGHLQPLLLMPSEITAATLSTPQEDEAPESGPQHEDKRSYSMEHFRWGKPVGRKRRPIKVYANGVEEESAEVLPAEMRRELDDVEDSAVSQQEKKDGPYKMNHFRWSGPPTSKRYGGFMKSWDERSQKPLLTLFKNIINKDGHQKKDH